jgi:hypothetical protein
VLAACINEVHNATAPQFVRVGAAAAPVGLVKVEGNETDWATRRHDRECTCELKKDRQGQAVVICAE